MGTQNTMQLALGPPPPPQLGGVSCPLESMHTISSLLNVFGAQTRYCVCKGSHGAAVVRIDCATSHTCPQPHPPPPTTTGGLKATWELQFYGHCARSKEGYTVIHTLHNYTRKSQWPHRKAHRMHHY
jgi:hypothetical protein